MTPDHDHLQQDYRGRINRAIDYLVEHLGEPITLEELARVSAFSPFHFHRIFSAIVGETVFGFLQRLRLERSVQLLVHYPRRTVTEIALEVGFSSSATFARAFHRQFGVSATAYRRERPDGAAPNRKLGKTEGKTGKAAGGENLYPSRSRRRGVSAKKEGTMHVEVRDLPGHHIAYIRHIGPYKSPTLDQTWERLCRWAGPRGFLGPSTVFIGLSYDDPDVTPQDRLRYDAAVTVPADCEPSGEIGTADVSGGRFAVLRYQGPAEGIHGAYQHLYGEWLPRSGYEPADAPPYEVYLNDVSKDPDRKFDMEICVPIRPAP